MARSADLSASAVPVRLGRPRLPRRWLAALGLAVILAGLAGLDRRVKHAGELPRRLPPSTRVLIQMDDLPGFWKALSETASWRALTQSWSNPLYLAELELRKAAGIRPNRSRWSLWMGPRAEFVASDEGAALTVRPGLLMRGAGGLHALLRAGVADQRRPYGPFAYAWHEGFLTVGSDGGYVQQALASGAADAADSPPFPRTNAPLSALARRYPDAPSARIWARLAGGGTVALEVFSAGQIPFEGWAELPFTARAYPLALHECWPGDVLAVLTAGSLEDLTRVAEFVGTSTPWPEVLMSQPAPWQAWAAQLTSMPVAGAEANGPAEHSGIPGADWSLVLWRIDPPAAEDSPPRMHWMLAGPWPSGGMDGAHPLAEMETPPAGLSGADGGADPGERDPALSPAPEPYGTYLGRHTHYWVAATAPDIAESAVAALDELPPPGSLLPRATAQFRMHWRAVGLAMETMLGGMGRSQADTPEANLFATEHRRMAAALQQLGTLRVQLTPDEEGLRIEGMADRR